MFCHACRHPFETRERVQFRDRCPACDAALHVCLNCRFFDATAYNGCRESRAERQVGKDRENRCDWFAPAETAPPAEPGTTGAAARAKFDALFGDGKD